MTPSEPIRRYPEILDQLSSAAARFLPRPSGPLESPRIDIGFWERLPAPDLNTYFTVGLSKLPFQHASPERPELLLSVQSRDISWGLAMGFVANQAGDSFTFPTGETIDFKAKISPDSEMSGFLIVPQMVFPEEFNVFDTGPFAIRLMQLLPLYASELRAIRILGPGFFAKQQPDPCSVSRPEVVIPNVGIHPPPN